MRLAPAPRGGEQLGRPPALAHRAENVLVSLALACMVLIPVFEILLRVALSTGFGGLTGIAQHMTLIVSMLGAAIAAREGRLISLSTAALLQHQHWARHVPWFTRSVAAAVSTGLAVAGLRFVLSERAAGSELGFLIPAWTVQLVLPVGFACIALRLMGQSSPCWRWRAASLLVSVTAMLGMAVLPATTDVMLAGLATVLIATILGSPIFAALGGATLLLFWAQGTPIAVVALDHYALVVNPSLPAIPLFTLAGYLLAESGAPRRLIAVFDALFGRLRAGAVIVSVTICTFFTCFTGASGVTILALGGLLLPLMLASRCGTRKSLGLITAGGLPGVLLAPSLPLILYAIIAQVPIDQMFLAGVLPTAVMMALVLCWGCRRVGKPARHGGQLDWHRAREAIAAAKWELALPLVVFVALFGGIATPVEAAALTALYAFIVEVFVQRDLSLRHDVPRIMAECSLLVGGVLVILGVALGFTNFLVDAQIPEQLVGWVTGAVDTRWKFLLALNLFLLLVGCLMDIFTAIVVVAPLIVPIGMAFGVHPIHLGIVFLANLELGYLTPPVGMNLFFSSYRFERPLGEVALSVVPLFLVLAVGVLLITYLPALSTLLPGLVG